MNMRHYVHKVDEARRGLIIRLGLPRAFHSGVASTVRSRDFHIKYQGEAHPGNPLRIDSAIIDLMESAARLCHIMTHRDGRIAATIVETDLKTAGAKVIGAGVFGVSELDLTNRVTMGSFFGRTTSSIAWFREGWPEFEDPAYQASGMSAALLEMRAVIHRYPKRGDAYAYLPAMTSANSYTRQFVHNLVDPISGESWGRAHESSYTIGVFCGRAVCCERLQI